MRDEHQRRRDEEHLNVLGVMNYVAAGLSFLAALAALPPVAIYYLVLNDKGRSDVPEGLREFMVGLTLTWLAACVVLGLLHVANGQYLRSRRLRGFSVVFAALQCLAVPLGTILGVFSLVVLGRQSVRELYDE